MPTLPLARIARGCPLSVLLAALLAAVLLPAPLPGAAQAPSPAVPASASTLGPADREIGRRLDKRLATMPDLGRVEANVVNGVALLHGEVVEPDGLKLAESIATQTAGVTRVENRIRVSTRLGDRFAIAWRAVGDKLVRLVAATPLLVVAFAIVLLASWIGRALSRRTRLFGRLHSPNPYMEGLVQRIVQFAVLLAGVLVALDLLGASSLVGAVLGSAGVVGLVLGFAFKDIAENYVAGILLSLRRPFAPGDHVLIDRVHEGKVVALTSRATLLMTLDGNQIALPNALVFRSVVLNYTENPKRRFDFLVPLDPSASVGEAQRLGLPAMAKLDGVLAEPAPSSIVFEYLHDRLSVQFMGWVDQREHSLPRVRSEAMRAVKGVLDQHLVRRAGTPAPPADLVPKRPPKEHAAATDTSADHDIDAQLKDAQRRQEPENLIRDQDATP